jgi:hypothetical protein
MRAFAILAASGLLLAACAKEPQVVSIFNPSEAAFANAKGNASIRGQLFLRRNDGVVVYGAGSDVRLIPRVSHSEQAMRASFGNLKQRLEVQLFGANLMGNDIKLNPGIEPYSRRTKADGQGNFVFEGVPPGGYFVVGHVVWCAPSRAGCDQQGGDLLETVSVSPADRSLSVIMNGV